MTQEQKLLLKKVCQRWVVEFPCFKTVNLDERPKAAKGAVFRCDKYATDRGIYYFLVFEFPRHRPGEFSLRIAVSRSAEQSALDPPVDYKPTPTNIGSHDIAAFMQLQSYQWDLVDVDARNDVVLAELGGPALGGPTYRPESLWQPSSYSLDAESIVEEAIDDVNNKLRRYVFPQLNLDPN